MLATSLKAHYVLASVFLMVVIVVMIYITSSIVKIESDKSLLTVKERISIQNASSDIRDKVWEADYLIDTYIQKSNEVNKNSLVQSIENLSRSIEKLKSRSWSDSKDRKHILSSLINKVVLMKKYVNELINLREDRSKRFPTLKIIENVLYPLNLDFITQNSIALSDVKLSYMSDNEAEYFKSLSEILGLWHRMISSFRLFVAYRSETINNPQQGMSNELVDIETLYSGVIDKLNALKKAESTNAYVSENSDVTDELIRLSDEWHNNFKVVGEIHSSDEWRKDDKVIRDHLQPLAQDIKNLLYDLDKEIDKSIQIEFLSLSTLASITIKDIWILGILILAFIIIGYIYINRYVLFPIANVSEALKRQKDADSILALTDSSTTEVNDLVSAFNDLSQSLSTAEDAVRKSDKMATVGELASCVAHEINNPLNNMSMIVDFARDEVAEKLPDSTLSKDVDILQNEIKRCAETVKNLLDFGRMKEPSYESASLVPIIEESMRLLHHKSAISDVLIELEIENDLPVLEFDKSQIHQVFVNLLINAIDFSYRDGIILITVKSREEDVLVEVIDHGRGLGEINAGKLFDPFYTTRKGHEGMGLGLSVCYSIIQNHQGEIGAYASHGGGLTVWFTIPLVRHRKEIDE